MLSPRQFVLAALVLGVALWVSRAVVDVAADGVRVAYVPSAPELLGLIVLGGLVLTLVQAVVERGIGRVRAGAHIARDAVVPLGALLLLFIPFLPWLPDRAPLAGELAGPLAFWVWAAVVACAAWALTASLPPRSREVPPLALSLLIVTVSAVVLLGARATLVAGPIYPGGDEPHYLVVTQSVVSDADLRIDDNHARGDYRAYFDAPLKPDHIVPAAPDGAIYSIHPVGVSLLAAPGFRLDGYRGASLTIVATAIAASLVLWQLLYRLTRAGGAATFGWLAILASAPFVLHAFAIYPEVPAALAVLVAIGWRRDDESRTTAIVRGVALGLLPWLGTKYSPMAAVIGALLVWRLWPRRDLLAALIAPSFVLGLAWLGWFWWIWGSPSPTAPYASAHQMAFSHLAAGLPGLFFDQEYGVVAAAPVLAAAVPGWWCLWRQGGDGRRLTLETALPLLALAATVGAYAMWWGGSAPPGRQLVAALPLLGVPLAALWHSRETTAAGRALLVLLLAFGIATTATLVFAHEGLLIANRRDGTAALLEYLSPSGTLTALVPSFTRDRTALALPLGQVAAWLALGALLWWGARRVTMPSPGFAGLTAIVTVTLLVIAGAIVATTTAQAHAAAGTARAPAQSAVLDEFDTSSRPVGVVFDPWRLVAPETIPPLMQFEAVPGLRVARQPVPVLLNMRLALPAGSYRVTIEPRPGTPISGTVGLQVGRTGPPQQTWQVTASDGAPWTQEFSLDLDANFVGLRAAAALERQVGRVVITPIDVVDAHRRVRRPPVLASAVLGGQPAYFHDTRTDVEPTGFWVRANASSLVTLRPDPQREPRGVRLQLHSGQGTTNVHLSTGAWETDVALAPGGPAVIDVPAQPRQRLLPVTITPRGGFVPAEHGGPKGDRRLLGCWVEVLP